MDGFVHLNVGGIAYTILKCDIEKFPESFFACLIKKEWSTDNDTPIKIARDGEIFRLVNVYLVCGWVPRSADGRPSFDPDTIQRLKVEADFYGLADLVVQCQAYHRPSPTVDLSNYLLMRKFIDCIKGYKDSPNMFPVDYSSELVNALKPLSTPFCLVSSFHEDDWAFTKPCIYNKSTCGSLDAAELLSVFSHQNQSTCKATEAGIDRRVVEIDAALLQLLTVSEIGARVSLNAFAPNHTLMELTNSEDDGVIIALQKLYPEYQQIDPSSLEGADKTLYDILTTATVNPFRRIDYTVSNAPGNEKYDVKLVTVVIHRCQEEEDKHNHKTRCVLFNAAAVERELGKSYAFNTEDADDQVPGANYEKERDHEKRKQDVRIGVNTKVLLPYPLDMEGLLEHAPEKWSDGIPEQFVFVVTCLQVHKK
eukprot:gene17054-19439_t